MIRIRPTTASGLSHVTYAIDLPGTIKPNRVRDKKVAIAIDGSLLVSIYKKRVDGATASKNFTMHPDVYKKLISIIYHETVFEWLVIADDKRYICEMDITNDEKITVHQNPEFHSVTISFLVIQELT